MLSNVSIVTTIQQFLFTLTRSWKSALLYEAMGSILANSTPFGKTDFSKIRSVSDEALRENYNLSPNKLKWHFSLLTKIFIFSFLPDLWQMWPSSNIILLPIFLLLFLYNHPTKRPSFCSSPIGKCTYKHSYYSSARTGDTKKVETERSKKCPNQLLDLECWETHSGGENHNSVWVAANGLKSLSSIVYDDLLLR